METPVSKYEKLSIKRQRDVDIKKIRKTAREHRRKRALFSFQTMS